MRWPGVRAPDYAATDSALSAEFKKLNALAERVGSTVRFAFNESVSGFHVKIAQLNYDHMMWVERRLLGKSD